MAVKKGKQRLWITIHDETKKSIELLLPLLKANSMGEVVDRAIMSYALAVIEVAVNQNKGKEKIENEKSN